MKSLLLRTVTCTVVLAPSIIAVQAHPGHDDGHELTWDFQHLAAHPWATLQCAALLTVVAWLGWVVWHRATGLRSQSLRKSHPSRGK